MISTIAPPHTAVAAIAATIASFLFLFPGHESHFHDEIWVGEWFRSRGTSKRFRKPVPDSIFGGGMPLPVHSRGKTETTDTYGGKGCQIVICSGVHVDLNPLSHASQHCLWAVPFGNQPSSALWSQWLLIVANCYREGLVGITLAFQTVERPSKKSDYITRSHQQHKYKTLHHLIPTT